MFLFSKTILQQLFGNSHYLKKLSHLFINTHPIIFLQINPPRTDWSEHEAAGKVNRNEREENQIFCTGIPLLIVFI